jgi:hypothetical protein
MTAVQNYEHQNTVTSGKLKKKQYMLRMFVFVLPVQVNQVG